MSIRFRSAINRRSRRGGFLRRRSDERRRGFLRSTNLRTGARSCEAFDVRRAGVPPLRVRQGTRVWVALRRPDVVRVFSANLRRLKETA